MIIRYRYIAALVWYSAAIMMSFSTASAATKTTQLKIASYNFLTISKAPLGDRLNKQVRFAERNGLDIIGAQEVSRAPHFHAVKSEKGFGKQFDIYPKSYVSVAKSARPILYNKQRFTFVSGSSIEFPSYTSKTQKTPWQTEAPVALLRDKNSGIEFYVINTHNSAFNLAGRAESRYRAGLKYRAGIEKLRQTGRPVLFTGDFNENASLNGGTYGRKRDNLNYCVLTRGDLMRFAPAAMRNQKGCTYTKDNSIDRIYVSPDVKVNSYRLIAAGMVRAGTDHRNVAVASVTLRGDGNSQQPPNEGLTETQCLKRNRIWKKGTCTQECKVGYVKDVKSSSRCVPKPKAGKDTKKPTVTIISPKEGYIGSKKVVMRAIAKDNKGVARVEFYVNDRRVMTDRKKPFVKTWDSSKAPNGAYTLTAIAYDAQGNKQKSTPITFAIDHATDNGDDNSGDGGGNNNDGNNQDEGSTHDDLDQKDTSIDDGTSAPQEQIRKDKGADFLPNTGASAGIVLTAVVAASGAVLFHKLRSHPNKTKK